MLMDDVNLFNEIFRKFDDERLYGESIPFEVKVDVIQEAYRNSQEVKNKLPEIRKEILEGYFKEAKTHKDEDFSKVMDDLNEKIKFLDSMDDEEVLYFHLMTNYQATRISSPDLIRFQKEMVWELNASLKAELKSPFAENDSADILAELNDTTDIMLKTISEYRAAIFLEQYYSKLFAMKMSTTHIKKSNY